MLTKPIRVVITWNWLRSIEDHRIFHSNPIRQGKPMGLNYGKNSGISTSTTVMLFSHTIINVLMLSLLCPWLKPNSVNIFAAKPIRLSSMNCFVKSYAIISVSDSVHVWTKNWTDFLGRITTGPKSTRLDRLFRQSPLHWTYSPQAHWCLVPYSAIECELCQ